MEINWTTVLSSGLVAAIITGMQFITTRYLGRILDRLEKGYNKEKDNTK